MIPITKKQEKTGCEMSKGNKTDFEMTERVEIINVRVSNQAKKGKNKI